MPMTAARDTIRDYLKQIVYGGNDGIITTFAVVAGFAGAEAQGTAALGTIAVVVFGVANLAADGVSMGLGEFLSGRSNRDLYAARHIEAEIAAKSAPDDAADLLSAHLIAQGLSADDARHTVDHLATSPMLMADLSLRYDHGMESPDSHNLVMRALMTFLSFIVFGAIPILPFMVAAETSATAGISVLATATALTLLGVLRWSVTRETLVRCVGETLAVGGFCAALAYGAGHLVAGF
jgi:VIT1/CCC1 family predicted Fe2+/Mn2+ transporter